MTAAATGGALLDPGALPRLTYFVCGLPRCGSNLLCTGLTGLAGSPDELFLPWYRAAAAGRVDSVAARNQLRTIVAGAAGGVLGVKIMRDQLDVVIAVLRAMVPAPPEHDAEVLALAFPRVRWIHLVRRDVVRQAISLVRARQTNQWYELQPWAAEALSRWDSSRPGTLADLRLPAERVASARAELAREQPAAAARYDFEAIAQQAGWLIAEDGRWSRFFDEAGIRPFRITYEALADRYEATIRAVLDHLQIEYDERRLLPPVLRRQSDGISEAWVAQFAIDRARAAAGAAEPSR